MIQPDSENEKVAQPEETSEIEELKKALAAAKTDAEANLAKYQRAQADFVNYKRFVEQDKIEFLKNANVNLLVNILPILDDFERALAAVPPEAAEQKWMEGFKLIDRKFRDTLEKQGVTPILTLGMEFDPRFMDAVTLCPGKRDMVIQELEKGYKLQDKVIRPAKVVCGSGETPKESNKEE